MTNFKRMSEIRAHIFGENAVNGFLPYPFNVEGADSWKHHGERD